jgi:hypothetical protein
MPKKGLSFNTAIVKLLFNMKRALADHKKATSWPGHFIIIAVIIKYLLNNELLGTVLNTSH